MGCEYALSYCDCKQCARHATLAHMVTPMLSPTRRGGDERGAALSPKSRTATRATASPYATAGVGSRNRLSARRTRRGLKQRDEYERALAPVAGAGVRARPRARPNAVARGSAGHRRRAHSMIRSVRELP